MRGGGVVSRSTPAAPAPIVSERSISLQPLPPLGGRICGANLSWANLHGVDLIDALRGAKK
jgi:hypothetical protein